jgi:hypothetical protein
MVHGDRLYRQLFRNGGFIGYDGGDRATPRPRRIFLKNKKQKKHRSPAVRRPWRTAVCFMRQKIFENYCIIIR